ncbi:MAG TPA: AroM family protein [Clostridia bacterium]|nr:AroM family protein [Clostridia bacterium]
MKAAVICMGQSREDKYEDLFRALPGVELEIRGILDNMTLSDIERDVWPRGGEPFIVSNIADGSEVRIAEAQAIRLVNERILELSQSGFGAALILCTGHFVPPETDMTVLVPERVIPALLGALGVRRLGAIVPEPEQIADSLRQYAEFNPIIRASSPYGSAEELAKTAEQFRDERVDLILTDCMGFTRALGEIVSRHSGKRAFVPRVILPALLGALMIETTNLH